MVFPVVMYGCDNWTIKKAGSKKNWCFWTVVLEKTLESSLDCKEIQPLHPKGDQSLVFTGRTDVEAKTPIFWPPNAKSWLIWKDLDARRDWGQEEKGMTEDEMAGWHHLLNGQESGKTPGVGDGQGGLVCCSSWGCKESDMTEWLTELNLMTILSPLLWSTAQKLKLFSKYYFSLTMHPRALLKMYKINVSMLFPCLRTWYPFCSLWIKR